MRKILHILCLSSIFTTYTFAQKIEIEFIETPRSKTNLTGFIPFIRHQGFEKINEVIQSELLNDESRIDIRSEILDENEQFLNLHIHLEIEGGRSYSREKYYVIDLDQKKIITLNEMIYRYELRVKNIEKAISQSLSSCLDVEQSVSNTLKPDYCEDANLEYFIRYYLEDRDIIRLSNVDSYYLKNDRIGFSYDAGAYSVTFEYNLKTHQIESLL